MVRSLRTAVESQGIDRAIQLGKELVPRIKAGVPTDVLTLPAAVHQYLESEQKRVDAGLIKPGAHRDKVTQLKTFLIFCKIEELSRIPPTFSPIRWTHLWNGGGISS